MVNPTDANFVSYETLYDKTITGGVAANIRTNIGEDDNRKILAQQAFEITEIEIVSPIVAATGVGEALEQIIPVIDGKLYLGGDQVLIRADLDSMFAPPKPSNLGEVVSGPSQGKRMVFKLGTGLPDLAGVIDSEPWRIIENTTIKTRVKGNLDFQFLVGNTAITGDFRIIAKGWRYRTSQTIEKFMRAVYGQPRSVPYIDPVSGRDFSFIYPARTISASKFTELIGGEDQPPAGVNVKRLLRWARNKIATTPNTPYDFSFDDGKVNERSNDMDFDVNPNQLIAFTKLGIRPGTNNLLVDIQVNDNTMTQEEAVPSAKNDLIFGRKTAVGAGITAFAHDFRELPQIQQITVSNETGKVRIKDDGTAVAAGLNFGAGTLVVLDALEIQNPAFERQQVVTRIPASAP